MMTMTATTATTATATTPTATTATTNRDLAAGARAMLPWLIGIIPYGLVIGVSTSQAGIPLFAGWLSGPLVFSGSAQVAIIGLLRSGALPVVAITAALVINLRLVLYSATMAPFWQDEPRHRQALFAYLLVDPSVAVGVEAYEHTDDRRRGHTQYLGGAIVLWVSWLTAIAVGATAGASLPPALHLEFVVPLFLAGEVASRLNSRAVRHAAGAAALVAVIALHAPLQLGPLLAILAGIGAGLRAPSGGESQ